MNTFFLLFAGLLFSAVDALESCTTNSPTDRYCWFGHHCCNKVTKLCCSDSEICTGVSCINTGGLVAGIVFGVVAIGVCTAIIVNSILKKKRQTGVVLNQRRRPGQVTVGTHQTGQVQSYRSGQVMTVTTINQETQGYPPPDYNSVQSSNNNNPLPGLNKKALPGLNNKALPDLNNRALPGLNNNALPGVNSGNSQTGYNNQGDHNTVGVSNAEAADAEIHPSPSYPEYVPNNQTLN